MSDVTIKGFGEALFLTVFWLAIGYFVGWVHGSTSSHPNAKWFMFGMAFAIGAIVAAGIVTRSENRVSAP